MYTERCAVLVGVFFWVKLNSAVVSSSIRRRNMNSLWVKFIFVFNQLHLLAASFMVFCIMNFDNGHC